MTLNTIKTDPDLIAEYFLRDLPPDELEQLQHLLESDPEARRQFVETGKDEWLLHHVHHMEVAKTVYFSTRKKRIRRIRSIAAGVVVLISLGTLYLAKNTVLTQRTNVTQAETVVAKVSDCFVLNGEAISVVNDGRVRKLDAGSKLRNGDRVVVPPGCRMAFQYLKEETTVRLDGGSLFHVNTEDGAKRIHLDQGRLYADVAKQPIGKPLHVATSDAEAVVLGTSFEILADQVTRLSVTSGKVRFNSKASDNSVVVGSGFIADSETETWVSHPFRTARLSPIEDRTLNYSKDPRFIAVDPVRNYFGFMQFDLGTIDGTILEAKLRLRVMNKQNDYGGSGNIRLFRVNPEQALKGERVQVAHYSGKVGGGMDLEFEIDPTTLSSGINALLIALDKNGNDFWFSSSKGKVAPQLMLKVVKGQ